MSTLFPGKVCLYYVGITNFIRLYYKKFGFYYFLWTNSISKLLGICCEHRLLVLSYERRAHASFIKVNTVCWKIIIIEIFTLCNKVIHPKCYKHLGKVLSTAIWADKNGLTHDISHDLIFYSSTIHCRCQKIRSLFRVLVVYNFGCVTKVSPHSSIWLWSHNHWCSNVYGAVCHFYCIFLGDYN